MFERRFEPLMAQQPAVARIAVVPWDTETFGFGVADLELGDGPFDSATVAALVAALDGWIAANGVGLVSATAPSAATEQVLALQRLGFRYVDTTLGLRYDALHRSAPRKDYGCVLEVASGADLEAAVAMAGDAFANGRYHADPLFDPRLANERYRVWLRRAAASNSPQEVLVAKLDGQVRGFSIVEVNGKRGVYHLLAVDRDVGSPLFGPALAGATINHFKGLGVRTVTSKISAANTPVLNLHASLGARYLDPQVLFHRGG